MNTKISKSKIIIVGGGFAGIKAAREIDSRLGSCAEITLISDKPFFEYYPALYRLVTGASPIEACVPLADMLVNTDVNVIVDRIVSVDPNDKRVTGTSGEVYKGDYLILALGSETAYFDLPGLSDLSFGFKSVNEALELKQHIHELFVEHEQTSVTECVSHFHIVVVGGGASGVEIAGDLTYFLKKLTTHHKVDPSLITIDLIESAPRLVAALDPRVSRRIEARLRKLGVNIYLNRSLVREEVEQVYLKDMSLKAKTVVWTAGTKVNGLYAGILGFTFNKKGRVIVDEYLQPIGLKNIFILGDAADTKYSGLAQTALADGEFIAAHTARMIQGKTLKSYKPKPVAYAIPVGENWGVISVLGIRFSGVIAYFVRHFIDFQFFASIVSVRKLFSMYIEGWKYRKDNPSCKDCNL